MSQGSHQPQSQRFVGIHLQVDGNSNSGVLDREETGALGTAAQRQLDIAARAFGEAVLEGIRNQFIQDQSAGDGQIRPHDDGFEIAFQADWETGVLVGRQYVGGERLRVLRKFVRARFSDRYKLSCTRAIECTRFSMSRKIWTVSSSWVWVD